MAIVFQYNHRRASELYRYHRDLGMFRSYKWSVVAMLWCVCFFNYADRQAVFSVFPLLKSQFNLTDVQLGIIGSAFMWVYGLFGPVCWLVRRQTAAERSNTRRFDLLVGDDGRYRAFAYVWATYFV